MPKSRLVFFLFCIIFLSCWGTHVCHGTYVELRRHLYGVGFICLPSCGFWGPNSDGRHLYPVSHLTRLVLFLFSFESKSCYVARDNLKLKLPLSARILHLQHHAGLHNSPGASLGVWRLSRQISKTLNHLHVLILLLDFRLYLPSSKGQGG